MGYILGKLDFDIAPLILAVVLGPILEKTLRQSLFYARGDAWTLFGRPTRLSCFRSAWSRSSYLP